ncbi:hypothetical protein L210DRAFT_3503944 [Boletus edulis BED1]|uniref:Uncharacterized protein n=1 Tax=Boletus edulis BED1 TaxID=1328754 RepID=A0AAD4GF16_BOLED|nr:hypothetical protein L210DRAFT_3503944 [Boletus edulis BED1]
MPDTVQDSNKRIMEQTLCKSVGGKLNETVEKGARLRRPGKSRQTKSTERREKRYHPDVERIWKDSEGIDDKCGEDEVEGPHKALGYALREMMTSVRKTKTRVPTRHWNMHWKDSEENDDKCEEDKDEGAHKALEYALGNVNEYEKDENNGTHEALGYALVWDQWARKNDLMMVLMKTTKPRGHRNHYAGVLGAGTSWGAVLVYKDSPPQFHLVG